MVGIDETSDLGYPHYTYYWEHLLLDREDVAGTGKIGDFACPHKTRLSSLCNDPLQDCTGYNAARREK